MLRRDLARALRAHLDEVRREPLARGTAETPRAASATAPADSRARSRRRTALRCDRRAPTTGRRASASGRPRRSAGTVPAAVAGRSRASGSPDGDRPTPPAAGRAATAAAGRTDRGARDPAASPAAAVPRRSSAIRRPPATSGKGSSSHGRRWPVGSLGSGYVRPFCSSSRRACSQRRANSSLPERAGQFGKSTPMRTQFAGAGKHFVVMLRKAGVLAEQSDVRTHLRN